MRLGNQIPLLTTRDYERRAEKAMLGRTTLVQKNRQKKPAGMFQHAMWCLSNFPNYTMENFWQNDFFEWDMEDLPKKNQKNLQRKDNFGQVATPAIT